MKNVLFFLVILLFISCKKKDPECNCRSLEDCVDETCVLQANSFYINNQGVKGTNLYHGVVSSNVCVDTLIFDINLADPNHLYTLYANVQPWGLYAISLDVGLKISDDEFVMGSGTTICRQPGGKEWYPSYVHCKIAPDSVVMTIKFLEWFDPSGKYVEECKLTLYK